MAKSFKVSDIKPITFRLSKLQSHNTIKYIENIRNNKGAVAQYLNEAVLFYEKYKNNIELLEALNNKYINQVLPDENNKALNKKTAEQQDKKKEIVINNHKHSESKKDNIKSAGDIFTADSEELMFGNKKTAAHITRKNKKFNAGNLL